MPTLYLRNVPDEVLTRLQRLAARDGASINATAVRELAEATRRADNPALLGDLPDLQVGAQEIVAAITSGRAPR
ncbi:MAG: FitA-like ribbon-helix-helix domain-containing protein [Candidatus Dormibacteraceae bacterium]